MKFNFGKIGAIACSLAVVGMTAGMVAAATYPSPFVSGGTPNVAIVYGANGDDLSSVTTIENDLTAALGEGSGGAAGGVPTGGDYVLLAKSSDNLNLGDTVSTVFGVTVDDGDLEEILVDGTYSADDNDDFEFSQKLTLGAWSLTHFQESNYEDLIEVDEKTPVIGFDINDGVAVINYTLDFSSSGAESDVVGTDLDDFEGSDLPLFGKNYFISDAKNGSDATFHGTWTLLDSAATETVPKDTTKTVSVDGVGYDVTLTFVDADEAKFEVSSVGGTVTTSSLNVGESEKLGLPGDPYISVRSIDYSGYAGGTEQAEFSIGSGKLELFGDGSEEVELNDEDIDGLKAYIYKDSYNGAVARTDKIILEWTTTRNEYLTSASPLQFPGIGEIKFLMNEFARSAEEEIIVQDDADTRMAISLPIKDGDVTIPLLGANSTGEFNVIGEDSDERLATSSTSTVTYNEKIAGSDYHTRLVASYNTSSDAESYYLSFTIDSDDNANSTTIRNEVTSVDICEDLEAGEDCTIGEVSLTVSSVGKNSSDRWVTLTAGTDVNFNTLYTPGGLKIYLPVELNGTAASIKGGIDFDNDANEISAAGAGHTSDTWLLFFDEENKDDNIGVGLSFNMTIDDTSDGDLEVSKVRGDTANDASMYEEGDDSKKYVGYMVSAVATKLEHFTDPDQDYAKVYYPSGDSESYAEVFIASEAATLGEPTLGDVRYMDTETLPSMNLIVVGGTCVNKVATMLLGMSGNYVCGDEYLADANRHAEITDAGDWVIETYDHPNNVPGKIATLVYGWAKADTGSAANYLVGDNGVETEVGQMYSG